VKRHIFYDIEAFMYLICSEGSKQEHFSNRSGDRSRVRLSRLHATPYWHFFVFQEPLEMLEVSMESPRLVDRPYLIYVRFSNT